jgi:hypothetical protein
MHSEQYVCAKSSSTQGCVDILMYLPEDVRMSGRNMYELYSVYNTLSCTYVCLLGLLSYLSNRCLF